MLPLILATFNFAFSCNQAQSVIDNVYQNEYLTTEDQIGVIRSVLESTPPECSAHYYADE